MTLLVFLGVACGLLILRELPGLVMRVARAVPRRHLLAFSAWLGRRRVDIVLGRHEAKPLTPRRCLKLVLVSSTLFVLALMATTEFWSTHTSMLMTILR